MHWHARRKLGAPEVAEDPTARLARITKATAAAWKGADEAILMQVLRDAYLGIIQGNK